MTDQGSSNVPAGWYADPENPGHGRYWDGTAWTEHRHAPGQQTPALRAPEGTAPYTPWIWAIVFMPVVTAIPLLFMPWGAVFSFDLDDPRDALRAQLAFLESPAYIASILLGFVTWGLSVLFAYLDHRDLTARQVPKPFHWAWAFIPSYGPLVYTIGRTAVVRSRLGGGALGPIWGTIGVFVFGLVIAGVMMAQLMGAMTELFGRLR